MAKAVNALAGMTSFLLTQTDGGMDPDAMAEVGKNLVGGLGNVLNAAAYTADGSEGGGSKGNETKADPKEQVRADIPSVHRNGRFP